MNKPQHTPTPWLISMGYIRNSEKKIANLSEGTFAVGDWSNAEQYANAALIVRAVNSHQALVEALESLFRECVLTHKHWGEGSNQRESDAAIEAARKALEQAKC